MQSYKTKSKLANIIVFICAFISYVGADALTQVMPASLVQYVPIIVLFAGYVTVQATEDKRVVVAEDIVREEESEPAQEFVSVDPALEYEVGDDDGAA